MTYGDDASERTLNGEGRGSTDTVGLYTALGVERDATPDELKRAYRRLALQHHPDRNLGRTHSSSEFVRIQLAYDVLSDARRRRIYNRYGEIGVQMAGRMGGELLDPLVSSVLCTLALASACIAVLLIVFFAMLARRVDGGVEWPFAVVFAPLWAADLVVGVVLVWARIKGRVFENSEASDSDDASEIGEDEAGVDGGATDATPLLSGQSAPQQHQQQRRASRRQRLRNARKCAEAQVAKVATAAPAAYLLLVVAFQVALVLRLDNHVTWSALLVATPWLVLESIHFIQLTLQLTAGALYIREQATHGEHTFKRILILAANTFWWLAIRVSLVLLVTAKLDGRISWSWIFVFAPTYVPCVWWAIALCFLPQQLRSMSSDSEMRQNATVIVRTCVAAFGVVASVVYSFVALLAWRLSQPWAVRLALVFVPVFAVLVLACCCCSCFSLCMACGIDATVEIMAEREHQAAPSSTNVVPPARRIDQHSYASLGST
ncbi:hypothetical protein IW148_000990 [Coemansia sp. RSA 1199]|nr:hypothetical protein IW148_000990 [Coemansia sp. RSA 1199]